MTMNEQDIAQYYKNVDATNAKRGRPKSKLSEEDKRTRQKAANKKWREKAKSIHVGRDEFDALNAYAEALSEQLGFTVNYRQALQYLLKKHISQIKSMKEK
jgi:hypothetical protein